MLSVQDIWDIMSTTRALPPSQGRSRSLGHLRYPNSDPRGGAWERSINMHRTCYLHIGQTKAWLPEPIRGVSWYGYGAPDLTYLVPLWPAMEKLPAFYGIGSRYEEFRRDSGWWVNTYVQEIANLSTGGQRGRAPTVSLVWRCSTRWFLCSRRKLLSSTRPDPEAALSLIQEFAYANAVALHEEWKLLGDKLLGKYAFGSIYMRTTPFPEWWNDIVEFVPAPTHED